MASARWSLLVLVMVTAPLLGISVPAAAEPPRVYHIDELQVVLIVSSTGDVRVLERIQFNFTSGNFSMAFRTIPHFGYDQLSKAAVYDDNGTVLKTGTTYKWDNFQGKYEVRWTFDPVLGPANKSFILEYTIEGGVAQVSKDQNAIDWYAVGPDWSVRIDTVNVTVVLPANFSKSPLLKTSPGKMDRQFDTFGTYLFLNRSGLSPHSPVRVIVHFPKSTELSVSWQRYLRENWMMIAALISGIVLLICILNSLLRFALARMPPRYIKPEKRLHGHPAKLATLLAGRYTPQAFLAAAVGLARKGALRMEHDPSSDDLRFEVREVEELLGSHDVLLLSTVGEDRSARALSARWPALCRELRKHCMIELRLDGFVRHSGRVAWVSVIGGLVPLLISSLILAALIYVSPWDAVLYGGVLLGMALAGASVLVVGGFLTPNRTFRGSRERAAQRAFIDGIQANLEETARTKPAGLSGPLLQFLPLMIAAGSVRRDKFADYLRRLSAAAPSAPLDVAWYDYRSPGGPSEPTLGNFGRNFSATAQELPRMLAAPAGVQAVAEEADSGLYSGKGDDRSEIQFTELKEDGKGEP